MKSILAQDYHLSSMRWSLCNVIYAVSVLIMLSDHVFTLAENLRGQEAPLKASSSPETSEEIVDTEHFYRMVDDDISIPQSNDIAAVDPDFEPWVESMLSYYECNDDIFDLPTDSASSINKSR